MTACEGCGTALPPSRGARPRKWCSERCRKRSYGDPCIECGAKTSFGAETARVPEPRCPRCATNYRRIWTRDVIVDRILEWNETYGDTPASADWNPQHAEFMNDHARAQRFRDGAGHWPHHTTVFNLFGSWNAAIEAAGFIPRVPHGGGGNELRKRHIREVAA